MEPESTRDVEVIVWSGDGDAVARLPSLASLAVAMDDERSLPSVVREIRARASLDVAVLALTDAQLHVEVLEDAPGLPWRRPDVEIPAHATWYEPGWYRGMCSTVERALRAQGIACTGRFEQRKHWSISAIVAVATTAGELWFKQVPDFMAHEGRVLEWLGARWPGAVPEVVAVGPDWSITRAFAAPTEEATTDSPFALLAELQQLAAASIDDLFALGCPDRRGDVLLGDLESLAGRDDVLEPEQRDALLGALPALAERCARLERGPVPPSLVHGDLHGGNWTRHPDGRWLIFDWTDACVAHPFLDLGVLPTKDERVRGARLRAYLDAWAADDDRLVADALVVANAHHAISYQRIVDGVRGDDGPSWHPAVKAFLDRMLQALG